MARQSDLEEAAEAADDLPDPRDVIGKDEEVPLGEIFDGTFMTENTDFDTFDEMVAASPSEATSADELGRIPRGEWDEFIAETTDFEDEEEFVFAARDHWVAKKLGLN
ncbi:hypothetical protein [Halobellus limi]|uniref:Uncharacterized protein n=1 Tax=Halobellus limi TaxID=699433 RepID=A0A1H6AZS6_9EURY|nr:hypothetical protein [Halobellus limi]QCC47832.1 hypothetical protein DV707_09280 [Halobellus limi]SEG53884.1 hypothetical protein SAMN04488133_2606 [Halobellus limi]